MTKKNRKKKWYCHRVFIVNFAECTFHPRDAYQILVASIYFPAAVKWMEPSQRNKPWRRRNESQLSSCLPSYSLPPLPPLSFFLFSFFPRAYWYFFVASFVYRLPGLCIYRYVWWCSRCRMRTAYRTSAWPTYFFLCHQFPPPPLHPSPRLLISKS